MSPSAYLREAYKASSTHRPTWLILNACNSVVNGAQAFAVETSKAKQLTILESLGLDYPKSRVVNQCQSDSPSRGRLEFPIVVKANIVAAEQGSSSTNRARASAQRSPMAQIDLHRSYGRSCKSSRRREGNSSPASRRLAESFCTPLKYTRLESPSISVQPIFVSEPTVSRCARAACPIDAPKSGLKVNGTTPPANVIAACEANVQSSVSTWCIEYMIDDRDGSLGYYDVNALSNFVLMRPKLSFRSLCQARRLPRNACLVHPS